MDLQITFVCICKDDLWGFTDLLNGREVNNETLPEIIELLQEDILSVIDYSTIKVKVVK